MAILNSAAWAAEVRRELLQNILPFWRERTVDELRGGFIAEMSNDLRINEQAAKGLILNARLLWTFSAAYRVTHLEADRELARRAYEYLTRRFRDAEHGGYFWEINPAGKVLDDKKKIYGQAFCVYALAEYYRAFHDSHALWEAQEVFRLLEAHAHDAVYGGYVEALSRAWQPLEDMRLSDKDMNAAKSMNNHLHLLEAYTGLLGVWPDVALAARLYEVICLFSQYIVNDDQTHFQHFFNADWEPLSDSYTFGHDIEGSWLLCEAAEALGDGRLLAEVRELAVKLARVTLAEGLDADGGLFYEGRGGEVIDTNKEWWPQAEAVVGFYNAWQLTGEEAFRAASRRCWDFIQARIVDHARGEWFWRVSREGTPEAALPKVSAWKCPYHNSRCCLEMLKRITTETNPRND